VTHKVRFFAFVKQQHNTSWFSKAIPLLGLIFIVLVAMSCAKRGTPSGGDKDTIPPVIVKADPP